MRVLFDTNVLLWTLDRTTFGAGRLSDEAVALIDDPAVDPVFSVVNIWEVAVKFALGRPDFRIDPNVVRRGALDVGLRELEVKGEHALAIASLPPIHRDRSTASSSRRRRWSGSRF